MPRTSSRTASLGRIGSTTDCSCGANTLFDAGYLTVTPDLRVRVSGRIREQFENGRDYYALEGRELSVPMAPAPPPNREYLEWHSDVRFRG